jgi:hypothetical protein
VVDINSFIIAQIGYCFLCWSWFWNDIWIAFSIWIFRGSKFNKSKVPQSKGAPPTPALNRPYVRFIQNYVHSWIFYRYLDIAIWTKKQFYFLEFSIFRACSTWNKQFLHKRNNVKKPGSVQDENACDVFLLFIFCVIYFSSARKKYGKIDNNYMSAFSFTHIFGIRFCNSQNLTMYYLETPKLFFIAGNINRSLDVKFQ